MSKSATRAAAILGIASVLSTVPGVHAADATGVKGTLSARACHTFLLYVNDKEVAYTQEPQAAEVVLRPGDIIKVQAIYGHGAHGGAFGMVFVSEDQRVVLSTDTARWRQFVPKDRRRWWVFDPENVDTWKAYKAPSQSLVHKLASDAGVACTEAIWTARNADTAHLFRVVTAEDLKPKEQRETK